MKCAPTQALRDRCAQAVVRLVRALPLSWRSTARRRRFLFLAACAPGFCAVAALPFHRNLWVLLAGTLGALAAFALRSLSEPTLIAGGPHGRMV